MRSLATGLVAYGIYSLFALNVGTKLMLQPTMEFWDFDTETPAFFGHLIGIVGLFASVSHYGLSFASTFAGKFKLQQPNQGWLSRVAPPPNCPPDAVSCGS